MSSGETPPVIFINTFAPLLATWRCKIRSSKADWRGSLANPPLGCSLGYKQCRPSPSVQNMHNH